MSNSRYFVDRETTKMFEPIPGVETELLCGLSGESMMMVLTTLQPGITVPNHSHPHEQVGMVYSGSAEMRIGDEERIVSEGDFYVVPQEIEHAATCISDSPFVAFEIFHPIREDFAKKVAD